MLTKPEIVKAVADSCGFTQSDVTKIYESVLDLIKDELADGENFALGNIGIFKVQERAARTCRNPKTQEVVEVPAKKTVTFRAGKAVKDSINA